MDWAEVVAGTSAAAAAARVSASRGAWGRCMLMRAGIVERGDGRLMVQSLALTSTSLIDAEGVQSPLALRLPDVSQEGRRIDKICR